ncbi:NAD(P)-binding domain-containing protein (plasmid) [Pseudomonas silvicola]|nr:NAD(P)-binding domain-containing protein [Pseudomonas silvicola]
MGSAIAQHFIAAGHKVSGWSRSAREVPGVTALTTAVEAFQADIVLTLLSDDGAIEDVIINDDLLSQANPHLVHIVMSTISVAYSR